MVRGEVDERDIWPFASVLDRDEAGTTLMVKAHDLLELVGVLLALLTRRLEVVSMRIITDLSGRTKWPQECLESPTLEAPPVQGSCTDRAGELVGSGAVPVVRAENPRRVGCPEQGGDPGRGDVPLARRARGGAAYLREVHVEKLE